MYNAHKVRLNRLFRASGRCLDVAIDHGAFNEGSFLEGIQDMERAVALLVEAGPDAIQLNFGQADLLQNLPGREKPALVMRTDTGNPYNPTRHKLMFDILACDVDPVLPAVKLDAACVVCNLLFLSDDPDLHRQTVKNIARLRHFCDQYSMPLMVKPLVMRPDEARGGYPKPCSRRLTPICSRAPKDWSMDATSTSIRTRRRSCARSWR